MTPELWHKVVAAFEAAQELAEPQRQHFLERLRIESAELHEAVAGMLAQLAHSSRGVLEEAPLEVLASSARAESSVRSLDPQATADFRPANQESSATSTPADQKETGDDHSVPAADAPPTTSRAKLPSIPGYEVLEELGRGGMGVVYKARQPGLKRLVALKMIRAGAFASEHQVLRFQLEAQVIAQIKHPHIVQVYEVGEYEGQPYFSLEYVDGGSLQAVLRVEKGKKPVVQPPRDAARLVELLAQVVHAAHLKGIVHRDLKPANILLADCEHAQGVSLHLSNGAVRTCNPKVTDFGLAKQLDQDEGLSVTGEIMGTPAYMAPEQAAGRIADIGTATDVYSLGVILYELLIGRVPFKGATITEILDRVRNSEPAAPRQLQANIPRDLQVICLKCLEKVPGNRYGSALELANELRRFLNGEPIQVRPVAIPERVLRWCRRKPAVASLIGVTSLFLLLLIPGVIFLHLLNETAIAESNAKLLAVELANTQKYHALVNGVRQHRVTQPAGWMEPCLQDLQEAVRLETKDRNKVELRTEAAACLRGLGLSKKKVFKVVSGRSVLAFHPNGQILAVAERRATAFLLPCSVVLVDIGTGKKVKSLQFSPGLVAGIKPDGARAITFSPDGHRLAVGTRGGRILCWDLQDTKGKLQSWNVKNDPADKRDDVAVEKLIFNKDGRTLYSAAGRLVQRWDCTSGKELAQFVTDANFDLSPDGSTLLCDDLQLINSETFTLIRQFSYKTDRIAFHPAGRIVAANVNDKIALLDVRNGTIFRWLYSAETDSAHDRQISHLAFHPGGDLLISASEDEEDRNVKIWEVASGELLATHVAGERHFDDLAVDPLGKTLAIGADDYIILHEFHGLREQRFLAQQTMPIRRFQLSKNGRVLICVGQLHLNFEQVPRVITIWNGEKGQLLDERIGYRSPPATFYGLDLHPGKPVITPWRIGSFPDVLDCVSGEEFNIKTSAAPEWSRFSHDGQRLWGIVEGKTLQCWNWQTGAAASRWTNLEGEVLKGLASLTCLEVGNQWLVVGGRDGSTRLFTSANGNQPQTSWAGPGSPVRSVALSPDESLACMGTQQGVARVVRVPSGKIIKDLNDHRNSVTTVAFSRDGQFLATGSSDRTVRLYSCLDNVIAHELSLQLPRPVEQIEFFPDGRRLAVLSQNETALRIWHLDRLCERLQTMSLISGTDSWPAFPPGNLKFSGPVFPERFNWREAAQIHVPVVRLQNEVTGWCLETLAPATEGGKGIIVSREHFSPAGLWRVLPQEGNTIYLQQAETGWFLESRRINPSEFRVFARADRTVGCQWKMEPEADGTFLLCSVTAGQYLTGRAPRFERDQVDVRTKGDTSLWRLLDESGQRTGGSR